MTRNEMLFLKLMEECNEVSQRVSKGLRFGWEEKQPGQDKNNIERLMDELKDLAVITVMLETENLIPELDMSMEGIRERWDRVEKYLEYSKERGTLTE